MTQLILDEQEFLDWAQESVSFDEDDDPQSAADALWGDVQEVLARAQAAEPPVDVTRWTPAAVATFLNSLPVADDDGEHRDDLAVATGVLVSYLGETGRWSGNSTDVHAIADVVDHVLDPELPDVAPGQRPVISLVYETTVVEDDEVPADLVPVVAVATEEPSPNAAARCDDLLAASPLLRQLSALLAWIAPGRVVTKTGGLRRGDFAAAAAAVGAPMPSGRVTAMWDIAHLGEMWRVAASAGLIEVRPSSVRLTEVGTALLPQGAHEGTGHGPGPVGGLATTAAIARRRAVIAFFAIAMTRASGRRRGLEPPRYADLYDLEPHLITMVQGARLTPASARHRVSRWTPPGLTDAPLEDPWSLAHHVAPVLATARQWCDLGLATADEAGTILAPQLRPLAATALLAVLRVDAPGLPTLPDLLAGTWPEPTTTTVASSRPQVLHRLRVTSGGPRGPVTREVTVPESHTLEDVHAAIASTFGRSAFRPFTISAPALGSRTATWLSDGLELDLWNDDGPQLAAWTTTLAHAVRICRGPWTYRHDLRHDHRDTVTLAG